MSARVTFADLLKVGAEKDRQRLNLRLAAPVPTASKTVAPENDFNKRANTLERDALPKGLFPGASKAIYDALYLRTLGAVDPTNMIQATRKQISSWSGVKNLKTVDVHLKKLVEKGIIKRSNFNGEHTGNYYEIYLPGKLNLADQNDPKSVTTLPEPVLESTLSIPYPYPYHTLSKNWVGYGKGNLLENKGVSHILLKTKTKSDDEPAALNKFVDKFFDGKDLSREADEILEGDGQVLLSDAGFGALENAVNQLSKKLIGRELKSTDCDKLKELAEMLVMELEIAAARTDSISNVPAFLTEHLRRRLSRKPDDRPNGRNSGAKADGKSSRLGKTGAVIETDGEIYRAEPLSEPARQTVLKTMRQYVEAGQREFVLGLEDTYTAEDWKWLSENLAANEAKK
jgi:hypothetical protein